MVVGESSERHALEAEVAPVAAFFTPFFFGFIGAQVDLVGLADIGVILLVVGVTVVAVATKFVGAFLGAIQLGRAEATLIGWGMVPRGEVGIVVAGLGLQVGATEGELYTVVVAMAVITTLIVPPFLPMLVRGASTSAETDARPTSGPTPGVEDDADGMPNARRDDKGPT
jgi:Kef-type K+ transport system membrane component KefB